MLHILLLVLKIIGIIIAVILGILVLLVCIVLFTPVCYQGEAACDGTVKGIRGESEDYMAFAPAFVFCSLRGAGIQMEASCGVETHESGK